LDNFHRKLLFYQRLQNLWAQYLQSIVLLSTSCLQHFTARSRRTFIYKETYSNHNHFSSRE